MLVFVATLLLAGHAVAAVTTYDCSGELDLPAAVQWVRVLVDSGAAAHTQGMAITPAGDGSGRFLVTGSAWSDADDTEYGLVVKMDPSGNILDAATFYDGAHPNGIYAISPTYNASQVLDGYIAAGFKSVTHKAPGIDNWWFQPDVWLLKLNLGLDMVWEGTFGMPGDDWANAVLQNDDGYLFGGALRDISAIYGGWLFQTDDAGNGLWSKSSYYYCSRNDEKDDILSDPCPEPNISSQDDPEVSAIIHAFMPTAAGGYISGAKSRMVAFDSAVEDLWTLFDPAVSVIETVSGFLGAGILTTGLDSPAVALTRVSADGAILWRTHYGQNASEVTELSPTIARRGLGLAEAADGGYLVAGRVEIFGSGSTDQWLIKTRPGTEGELDWAIDLPGVGLHAARSMMVSADGDLIVVGSIVCDGETRMLVMRIGVTDLQAPAAAFSIAPAAPYCIDQEITFDAGTSSDPDGTVMSYEWKFGDGTVATGPVVTHRYALAGDYTVELEVRDDDGLPAFEHQTITVGLPGVIWERTYANTPECLEQTGCARGVRAYAIIEAVDGGFVIAGRSNFLYTGTRYDAWLLKLFDNGIGHWEKNLTGDSDVVEQGSGITVTVDGGYAVAGTFMPYAGEGADVRTMLIKTDGEGTPAWHRVYTDYAGAIENTVRRRVLSLDNGEFLVAGHRWRDDANYRAMWLLHTDADGWEILGASRLFPPQEDGWNDSVCLGVDFAYPDGFVLTGYYGSNGVNAPLPVFKTDEAGDLEWSFHWPAASWNKKVGQWVAAVDAGYVVAGQANANYGRAAVMKVSADGSESTWVSHVPFAAHGTSGAVDGALTPDGGVAVVGWINAPTMYSPTKMFVAKFTGEGVCQWHQVLPGDADYAFGTAILALDDGSLLVLGDECNYSGHYGCRSRLIKIGPNFGPVTAFDTDVREGSFPLTVQFSDLTSGGSAPYTYAWDFDNDGTVDATDQNPTHIYADRGTFTVRLEVTDDVGRTDSFVCEACILSFLPGIYTDAVGVEILDFAVTDDAAAEPETYDFTLAPEGLDEGGAFGFTLDAVGPDGSHAFRITFPSPYDPSIVLYKLPDWEVIPYTAVDAYTIEVVLDILAGELDPVFVLADDLPRKPLTILVEGSGTTDPPQGIHTYYVDGTLTVAVTAIPDEGWVLDRWGGAVSGSDNPVEVTLTRYSGDTTLTAHFVLAPNPPVIEHIAVDGCINELCEATIAVTATDPAGGALWFAWTALDGGSTVGVGDTVDFDPPNASLPPDCLPFRVTVAVTSDVSGLTTEQTVAIMVKLAGDANGDGVVNILDKVMVRNSFGSSGPPGWISADVDCNGVVNILDKVVVRNEFGQSGCECD